MAYAAMPDSGRNALIPGSKARPSRDSRRELEFRRARRHSATVNVLKLMLPLAAAGILSLYALPSFLKKSIDHGRGTATVRGITLEAGSLKMLQPHVKGVNERGETYDITGDTATQAAKDADIMYLETIRGKLTGLDGKITTLTAPSGVHNNKAEEMTFNNGAVVTREGGMSAIFQTATAYMKTQMLVSQDPVVVRLHESTIRADTMTLYWGEQRAVFEGHVRTHLERQPEAGPSGPSAVQVQGVETGPGSAAPAR